MSDEHGTRVTNGDLGRRVGSLEDAVAGQGARLHELANEVTVIKLQGQHSQELMRSKFEALGSAMATTDAKVDRLLDRELTRVSEMQGLSLSPDERITLAWASSVRAFGKAILGTSILTALAAGVAIGRSFGWW